MQRETAILVDRILRTRDEAAFRDLVRVHAGAVARLAATIVRDRQAAEDVAQETFWTVSRKLGRFDKRRSLRAWILGIAYRHALKARKKQVRTSRREEQIMVERTGANEPHHDASRREAALVLNEELRNLPAAQRVLVTLHYQEGLSYTETAAAAGIRPGTAKSRIGRALAALRTSLSRRGVALSAGGLPSLLGELPAAHAGTSLVEACVTKGMAGLAAPAATGLKVGISVAVLAVTGAVVGIAVRDPGSTRAVRGGVAGLDGAPRAVARGGGPLASRADGTEADTVPVHKPEEPAVAPKEENGEPFVVIDGKKVPLSKILGDPNRVRIGPDGKISRGPVVVKPGARGARMGSGPMRAPGRLDENGNWVWPKRPRFASAPRHFGAARVEGRVVDASGAPLAGAKIYRLAPNTPRADSTVVSGAYTDAVGASDSAGRFAIAKQKAGRALFMADYEGTMLVPGNGIDTANAVWADLRDGETANEIVIKVPLVVSDLATLGGTVRDKDGKPIAGAQVWLDMRVRIVTKRDGSFDFGPVPAGDHVLMIEQSGLETHEEALALVARESRTLSVEMPYLDEGPLRLAGIILDSSGEPVVGARVYLGGGSGTIRQQRTDERGHYGFERLSAELKELALSLHVDPPKGYFNAYIKEAPFPSDSFEIRIDRAVEVSVKVVSAADGKPVQQLGYELQMRVERDGEQVWYGSRTGNRFFETGVIDDLQIAVGKRVRLKVEAPGHKPHLEELDSDVAVAKLVVDVTLEPGEPEPDEDASDGPK